MQNGNAEQFQVMAAALSDLQVGMDVLSLDVQDIKESMGLAVPAMHPAWVNRGGVKESPAEALEGHTEASEEELEEAEREWLRSEQVAATRVGWVMLWSVAMLVFVSGDIPKGGYLNVSTFYGVGKAGQRINIGEE